MKKDLIKSVPKNTKIALGAVILVVIVALVVQGSLNKKGALTELSLQPIEIQQPITPKGAKTIVESSVPVDNRSYSELVVAYKGRILQFGKSCEVHISRQVYKVGSEILLDNRGDTPVIIKLGSAIYSLDIYGYKIVDLPSVGEFLVDCGNHENVATLIVQK